VASRGWGQENDCSVQQDLELKRRREGTLQHGPGAILEGAIGSGRQSGWLREILGPEGCPRTCNKTVTKRQNAKKNKQSGARPDKLAGSVAGTGAGSGRRDWPTRPFEVGLLHCLNRYGYEFLLR